MKIGPLQNSFKIYNAFSCVFHLALPSTNKARVYSPSIPDEEAKTQRSEMTV